MAGTCGERMVPGTDVSANSMYKCCNGKVSGMDQDQIQNEEILEHSNQLSAAKPPRNLATMRHCSSSAWLSESILLIGRKNASASSGWRAMNLLFPLSISSMNWPSMP
ncbi:hypothetical protein ACOSQ4_022762 [Xanthoceras sorbifolium]